ncbi:MAG: tetratricopeptide repeat protein [Candidatus Kapabacteria bacterium]|nr:tetratricopeptide repeat protein [Candidatus Kapabacteria bacterium]
MKYILLVFIAFLFINPIYGQSFKEQFNELKTNQDTTRLLELLQKWERTNSDDPELYVAYINYFMMKSNDIVHKYENNPKEDSSQLMTKIEFNLIQENLNNGLNYIEKGIIKFPSRLDMRFGKIYVLGQLEDYENFTNEIIKTIDYSAVIDSKWLWTDNKPFEDPLNNMLGSVQEYVMQLYNTENDSLLDNMRRISETVLKYYPEHIESMSNISVVCLLKKEYDKGLEVLFKAEKIAPEDYIILANIAQAYKLKGDNINSIKYYQKVIQFGNEQAKAFAKEQIKELEK